MSCQEYVLSLFLTTVDVDLDHLAEIECDRFLQHKVTLSFFLHLLFGRKPLFAVHVSGVGSYTSLPWRKNIYINYLEFYSIRNVSLLPYISFFNHLFISVWTYRYLFYALSYNSALLHLLCCSNYFSFGHWELLCCFDIIPSLWDFGFFLLTFCYYKMFNAHPYTSWSSPRISHFSQDSSLFLLLETVWETKVWALDLVVGIRLFLFSFRLSQLTAKKYICAY